MWIFLGIVAIITAILNVIWTIRQKDTKWLQFISLAFTALTICAQYSMVKKWVLEEDWSALLDVVPSMTSVLWIFVFASIVTNSIALFIKKER